MARRGERAPILFAYNDGAGSASAWLHMGILGPKRTKRPDDLDSHGGLSNASTTRYGILDPPIW